MYNRKSSQGKTEGQLMKELVAMKQAMAHIEAHFSGCVDINCDCDIVAQGIAIDAIDQLG
jgi:hypothetical protein